jgi:hypothetical protein
MISLPAKRTLIVLFVSILTSSFTIAQTRFSIFAGPQLTTANYAVQGEKQNTDFKPGFLAGVGAKIEFEGHLYFSPAVYYSLKGYNVTLNKASTVPDPGAINNNVCVHTIETAFLLQYDLSKKLSHFFIKLGPSLDFQILGKEKFDRVDGTRVNRNMQYSYVSYGRYAVSAVLQVGYEMSKGLFFSAQYEHGLTDLNNADDGPSIRYRNTGITFGKYFK